MNKCIMVVDDEPDNITTVQAVLEANKYKVISASNGDECLEKIKSGEKPDLVLMDIMMPGTPVSKIIPKLGDVKVAYLSVVRTSEAEKEDLMKSKNIVGFIQKPFDVDELLEKVNKLVEK
ncbi:response regulator [Candidatus Woesearchaeota archaeon]|nr:response regulator [Candidatus Woesearchaeota archaeon]